MSFIKSKLQTAINNNMKNTFKTLLFISLLCGVSGADEIKSVMEGDSVTLQTDENKILTYNNILWRFGVDLIAEITDEGKIKFSEDAADGRFRGRLKLDQQTGSLNITNTRTIHSGEYNIEIETNTGPIEKIFTLTVSDSSSGIDPDKTEVKSVSVTEGESVTLNTDINPHGDELIVWWFRCILIAKVDKENNKTSYPDERFKGRIHLDQTGSLIISNSRTEHTGEYKLKISSSNRETIYKRFSLYVKDSPPEIDPDRTEVKSVSGTKGKSVSLNTDIKPHGDELIVWWFGNIIIAKDDKVNKISFSPDGRFKDRMYLDQTGSLIITDIRAADTGEYKLKISSNNRETKLKTFNLTVNHPPPPPPPPMSGGAIAGITVLAVVVAVLLVAAVGVIFYRRWVSELERLNDKVRIVSVMKEESVTLITDDAHIKTDEVNVYHGDTRIAEIRRGKITPVTDEFRGRLKLDQTGSLTISNGRHTDSGVYKLKIIVCTGEITFKTIIVHVFDEVISQTVKEGNSFYLLIGVTELQEDAEVELKFEDTVIAEKKQTDKMISVCQDAHDGKFKQNLQGNSNRSLVITDIRPDQSGDYELNITSSRITVHQIFCVFVSDTSGSVSPPLSHGKAREYIINPVTEGDSGPSRAVTIDEENESVSLMMK